MTEQAEKREQFQRERRSRWRACLLGCGITLLVLMLVVGIGWWYASRHLGDLVAGIVRQRAAESLNGTLEFADLEIDLAGRAVLTDVAVYPLDSTDPVLACPRIAVGFDLLTFVGPNRGKRAVSIDFFQPQIKLTREVDGQFNLAQLVKEREESGEPLGVAVHLHDAQVDFTDACLLNQSYPSISPSKGLVGELVDELGYRAASPAEVVVHREPLVVAGNAAFNPEREQLSFDLRVNREHEGGQLTAQGQAASDGSTFDIELGARSTELSSLQRYINAVFPTLGLAPSTKGDDNPQAPALAGLIQDGHVQLRKQPGQPLSYSGHSELAAVSYRSTLFPDLSFPILALRYDDQKQVLRTQLELSAAGCTASGQPVFDFSQDLLSGSLVIKATDAIALFQAFEIEPIEISGTLTATGELAGSPSAPEFRASLDSEMLKYGQLQLGRLNGQLHYKTPDLQLSGLALTGGELPLKASMQLDTQSGNGGLSLSTSAVQLGHLLDIAAKFSHSGQPPKLDVSGAVALLATFSFQAWQPRIDVSAESDLLKIKGFQLAGVTAKGRLDVPNLKLEAVQGTLLTAEPVNLAGFTSDGPLRTSIRLGGSISKLDKGDAALALVGEAKTRNLDPAQANASFKIIGPAADPEIRMQVKSTHAEKPLLLTAVGHYREGFAPWDAHLSWHETTVDFDGRVDFPGQQIEGELNANDVDLKRFSGDERLSGVVTAKAHLGGTFTAPTVNGRIDAPVLGFSLAQRTYSITDLSAGFKLAEDNAISVADGGFSFEGNPFTIKGVLGREGSDITASCQQFNLFSALALVPVAGGQPGLKTAPNRPPLQITSSGPLVIRINGELADPRAAIAYQCGAGAVEGHAFKSAKLAAKVTKERAYIEQFAVNSEQGSIDASGSVEFDPLSFQADAALDRFDIGVLTPLASTALLADLTGLLNGELSLRGTPEQYSADGNLVLTQGKFKGIAIDQARAALRTSGKTIELSDGLLTAEGTTLNASGTIDPRNYAQSRVTATAESLDLRLLAALIPKAPAATGLVGLTLKLSPGKGNLPDIDGTIFSVGNEVSLAGATFNSVHAEGNLRNDLLTLKRCTMRKGGSELEAGGTFDFAKLASTTNDAFPLDIKVKSDSFNFADLKPLLPAASASYRELLPQGVVHCDLKLSGTSRAPLINGSIRLDVSGLPSSVGGQPLPLTVQTLAGKIDFNRNRFDIASPGLRVSLSGTETVSSMLVTGSGGIAFEPPYLSKDTSISVNLAPPPEQRFLAVRDLMDMMTGSLGGLLTIKGNPQQPLIAGNLTITEPGGETLIKYKPPTGATERKPAAYRLADLGVLVQEGTKFVFKGGMGFDLEAELTGALTINGIPGVTSGPDALSVIGDLTIPQGSARLYRHVVRLEGEDAHIFFRGEPGDLYPYLTGRGTVIIPDVLSGSEVISTGLPTNGMGGLTPMSNSHDLTVYFNFNNVKLDPQGELLSAVQLSSSPALPVEQIKEYLLGGVGDVLTGRADLSEFARGELTAFSTSFISREIERMLELERFRVGGSGSDENPYYVSMEKELTPELSLTYFRNFFTETDQSEEYGVKYSLLDNQYQNVDLVFNFQQGAGFEDSGSEVMFQWSVRF